MRYPVTVLLSLLLGCSACHTTRTSTGTAQTSGRAESVTEKYWKLILLDGKPVQMKGDGAQEPHFILREKDGRVAGNGGCNGIGGNYQLLPGNRIRFSNLLTTMMACEGITTEHRFLQVLGQADHYNASGDTLQLQTKNKTLAVFQAVYLH